MEHFICMTECEALQHLIHEVFDGIHRDVFVFESTDVVFEVLVTVLKDEYQTGFIVDDVMESRVKDILLDDVDVIELL